MRVTIFNRTLSIMGDRSFWLTAVVVLGAVLLADTLLALQDRVVQDAAAVGTRYTAGEVLTFFAAAGVLITGVGAVIVNIIVALRTGTKIDDAAKKTDSLVAAVAEVHDTTNSGLSAVKAELTLSNALNVQLRDVISDLKSEREKAAVKGALTTSAPGEGAISHDAVVKIETKDALVKIEANTAETVDVLKDQGGATKPPG